MERTKLTALKTKRSNGSCRGAMIDNETWHCLHSTQTTQYAYRDGGTGSLPCPSIYSVTDKKLTLCKCSW